ncbi:MAG: hypothetical protein MZV63_37405 [Marinilabiliales bacterium]|nr:hypothetical protein [Marinilabiliales bacterium]
MRRSEHVADASLEMQAVALGYGTEPVLRGVDLSVERGQPRGHLRHERLRQVHPAQGRHRPAGPAGGAHPPAGRGAWSAWTRSG